MRRRRFLELLAGSAAAGALGPVLPSAVAGDGHASRAPRRPWTGRTRRRGRRSPNGCRAACSASTRRWRRPLRSWSSRCRTRTSSATRSGEPRARDGRARGPRARAPTPSPRRAPRTSSAAVDFARAHRLRLVVKGGGHSYHGTSNAPDSLLVWTRAMEDVTLHDAFVPRGCEGKRPAGAGGERRGGRALVSRLRRGDHAGWSVRAGRRMRHGGRRRARAGRRVRELLQAVRHGCGEPARGRGGDRGRGRPDGERLHPPGPLLGAEGRRRPELRRRHPADAADPRAAGDVRCGAADSRGGLRCDRSSG